MMSFPFLTTGNHKITSPRTPVYNCIGWAAAEDYRWWWPVAGQPYYWPPGAPLEETVEAFVMAFKSIGYERCDDGDLESGFEKVAIYATAGGIPTHMSRQLLSGLWTSKLGGEVDIEHHTLHDLEGPVYGQVAQFMRRPVVA